MKQTIFFSLMVVGAMFLSGCAPLGETPEQMITEAKALDQRFIAAYNNGDVDAVMATYWNSPDLVSYPPGALEVRGWEAAKEGFAKEFSSMKGTLEFMEPNYRVAGDVVMGWGKWRFTMSDPPMEMMGRYTDVKAKRDGRWVYILDHASAPLPPASGTP